MKSPSKCPSCGSSMSWNFTGYTKTGFSTSKAVLGSFLLGPAGALAGLKGKKKCQYYCSKCGYSGVYDDM